jgi:hypothetical protein
MSEKKDENGTAGQNDPAGQSGSGGSKPPEKKKQGSSFPTVEEHAKNLNINAPVFAAVIQSENWASGKRVQEADFKKAVDAFLKSPMGGTASRGGA